MKACFPAPVVIVAAFALCVSPAPSFAALEMAQPQAGQDAPSQAQVTPADGFVTLAERAGRGGGGGQMRGGGGGGQMRGVRSNGSSSVNHNVNANRNGNFNSNNNINRNTNRNTNINRNVNVDVHNDYHGGWDDHWHPYATAAAVTATAVVTAAVVGSVVHSVPPSCGTVIVNGLSYYQCGSSWYQPQYAGSSVQYVVVNAPR